jgi:hypothetical protein
MLGCMAKDRSTWDTVEMPLLEHIADHQPRRINLDDLAPELGLDLAAATVALRRLREAGYVTGQSTGSGRALLSAKLTERGIRAAGIWPANDPYGELLDTLEAAIGTPTARNGPSWNGSVMLRFRSVGRCSQTCSPPWSDRPPVLDDTTVGQHGAYD